MAMFPFCGYNMAMYFRHWLDMGKKMKSAPRIFHVNWFRMDEHGKFLWPGFRENLRILEWIVDRCDGQVDAVSTPIGYIPRFENIDLTGLSLPPGTLEKLFNIDKKSWQGELEGISKFFKQFKKDLPQELWQEYESLKERISREK
jgi:phosphoenolpyruvate carboxykinase (GTP)